MSRHVAHLSRWATFRRHRRAYQDGTIRAACRRRARQLAGSPIPWGTLQADLRAWPTIELP